MFNMEYIAFAWSEKNKVYTSVCHFFVSRLREQGKHMLNLRHSQTAHKQNDLKAKWLVTYGSTFMLKGCVLFRRSPLISQKGWSARQGHTCVTSFTYNRSANLQNRFLILLQHYHNTGGKKRCKSCCTAKYMTHLAKSNYKRKKDTNLGVLWLRNIYKSFCSRVNNI